MNASPLPDAHDPLPIPVSTFDFLRPHTMGGPQNIFNPQYVKTGDRLFGSISVTCPDCSRGHTYIVSIVWGSDGWYTEITDKQEAELIIPPRFTRDLVIAYFTQLQSAIPETARIPIRDT